MTAETGPRALAVRGESTNGRGRARGAVPRSRFRRNPKGAWVLLGSAIVRLAKIARPRMRAIAALLLLDDPHRDRLRRRALRSPHFHSPIWKFARSGTLRVNTHARDPLYFHHGLLASQRRDSGENEHEPDQDVVERVRRGRHAEAAGDEERREV